MTLHPTGQYCKKINGRIHYFGTNKKQALERYLEQATYLHGGQDLVQTASNGNMTLKQLWDFYLRYQHSKVLADELTPRHHNDQTNSLSKLMSFLGQGRKIKSISTLDLQNYKRKLQSAYGSAHRLNLHDCSPQQFLTDTAPWRFIACPYRPTAEGHTSITCGT